MIDWTIQRTIKNYCGFCDGSPSSPMCSGECFKGHEKSSCNNRVDHVITMLKQIPEEIERLKKLEKDFINNLKDYSWYPNIYFSNNLSKTLII